MAIKGSSVVFQLGPVNHVFFMVPEFEGRFSQGHHTPDPRFFSLIYCLSLRPTFQPLQHTITYLMPIQCRLRGSLSNPTTEEEE